MTRDEFRTAMEDILGVPHGRLKDSDSRDTMESWSSIADVQILAYLTSETGIDPDAELMEADTFGDLVEVLDQRAAFSA
jgi:hypothetical protein